MSQFQQMTALLDLEIWFDINFYSKPVFSSKQKVIAQRSRRKIFLFHETSSKMRALNACVILFRQQIMDVYSFIYY